MTTRRQDAVFLLGQSRLAQLLNDQSKKLRRRGQVEQIIGLRAMFLVYRGQLSRESRISRRIAEFAALIVQPLA